jgi:hypothetical protein
VQAQEFAQAGGAASLILKLHGALWIICLAEQMKQLFFLFLDLPGKGKRWFCIICGKMLLWPRKES